MASPEKPSRLSLPRAAYMVRAALRLLTLLALAHAPAVEANAAPLVRDEVDWPAFLARHDLVWEQLPLQWNEGAFTGNGNLGVVAYATLADNRFDFHLGRMDVTDHRKAPDRKSSIGVKGASVMFDYPRLDVGRMALRPAGKITGGTVRQALWNAELTGVITTDLGELRWRALTLRDRMVNVIEVTSTEKTPGGATAPWRWEFLPGSPSSPRAIVRPKEAEKLGYQPNPAPVVTEFNGVPACVQTLTAGGDFATAWLEQPATTNQPARIYISTANEVPAAGRSGPRAATDARAASTAGIDALLAPHRAWWHDYYGASFLTVPDARLESFYWIQMYKLACCVRPDGPALDVLGPFYRTTSWPGIWWNLNIQLSYWPVYAGNHLDLGESFTRLLDERFDELLSGFRGRPALGDFTWALHNYWWQLRFAGDWTGVHTRWVPKARAMLDAFEPLLVRSADGRVNLAPMGSPEYHGFTRYPNATYNLGLLRWLLNALIEADARAPQPDAVQAASWRALLAALPAYPADENGLRIAENQSFDESHRHFSHLLPLFPLYQLSPDKPEDRALVLKSVRHWHHIGGDKALTGYSFTGGASLYASLGLGDEAMGMLHNFLRGDIGISQLHASTFYTESGGRNPVIETPLSAASSTMDLLLQSWGGKIRVFPAVPAAWGEASFRDLRAMDGFLVSAAREHGATAWVSVRSEAGEPCVLKVPGWTGPLETRGPRSPAIIDLGAGEYRIDLLRGESVLVFPRGHAVEARIAALPLPADKANPYGVKRGGELKTRQVWPEDSPLAKPPSTP